MSSALQPVATVNSALMDRSIMSMDPELQKAIVLHRSGLKKKATSSTAQDEISVLAKVSNPQAWLDMTGVRSPTVIGKPDENQESIVTGRIPIKLIEKIRTLPFISSHKAARRIKPALAATILDMEAGNNLPPSVKSKNGKGTVVGIIDFGCDFAHKNFLKLDGTTRVRMLWNQSSKRHTLGIEYGELFSETDINTALAQVDPYAALGYKPEPESHGTHVTDIAAGNGQGTGVSGIASEADIIFVDLDGSDIPWEGQNVVGTNFGDSVQLLEAMNFIFQEAGNKPCVINASLGTNGGPHDGSSLVEQGIDRLVKQKPNRAVVIAASNSYADNIHATGSIDATATYDLSWYIPTNDKTENEIEIWYNGAARLDVELLDPSGTSLGTIPPGESGTVADENGDVTIFIANRLDEPNNHDNMIGVYMGRRNQGTWTLRLKNTGTAKADFHAWIERDDNGQSSFPQSSDNSYTLGSLSCGQYSVVVGSYDAHRANKPLSYFSSAGPTRDGRQKPEVSAPGHEVRAANSLSVDGVTVMSGTSMASPAVTGAIAVFLSEARVRKLSLSIEEIRTYLSKGSRRGGNSKWDQRYGFGRLSLRKMIEALPKTSREGPSKKRGITQAKRAASKGKTNKKAKN